MNSRFKRAALVAAILAASTPLPADDLSGSDTFLCTAVQSTRCQAEGECVTAPPWTLNIPQFIIVDLEDKTLRTTPASGENRATPIRSLARDDGMIFLQGIEGGRAFSFVITEATGRASIAVATEEASVGVFGACTPSPASR